MKMFNLEFETQLSPRRKNIFAFTALAILILSVYSNTFDSSWHFDDRAAIKENAPLHLNKLNWESIKGTFFCSPKKNETLYRPVACLSLAINYYFGQHKVIGYHLVNISVHILAAIFLFLFIYHTLNLPLLKPKYGSGAYFIALFSAVFWAINPVQTETVTYIVQRMAGMAAMFYIMAMYFYLKARTSLKGSSQTGHYFACVMCSFLAFGSKENAVMLPFSILLFDLFLIQGLEKQNIKRNIFIFLILLVLPIALAIILRGPSILTLDHFFNVYESKRPFGPGEHLLTEPRVILFYISLLFYPMPERLSITHDVALSQSIINPLTTIIAILTILMVLGVCLIKSRRWPFITYCILFFFMNHLIESSIFGLEVLFEHRNYLPSMLLFAPLAILLVKAIGHYSNRRVMQVILSVFIILVLVGFGHSTFLRNRVWKTEETLWADAKRKAPGLIRPHLNLGVFFLTQNRPEEALKEFTLATTSRICNNITDKATALYNMGIVHQRLEHFDLALEYYQKSAEEHTAHADTHNNMGLLYRKKGQMDKAEQEFLQALRYGKNVIQPHKNISLLLLKEDRIDEAIKYLNLALGKWPNDSGILGAAGYAYRLKGSYGKAFLLIKKSTATEPHDAKMHLYLSELYFKMGKFREAEIQIQEFLQREKKGDFLGYVKGTATEENIVALQPYKKWVMGGLAVAYNKSASDLEEKMRILNGGKIPEIE